MAYFYTFFDFFVFAYRVQKKRNFTEGGIVNASKENMREFMTAVLVDNDKNQRMMGLQDQDIAEIYETSCEIIQLNEVVSFVLFDIRHSLGRRSLSTKFARG